MSALAKLVRLQPRSSLSSFRLQTSRTLSIAAARLHRPSLTRAVPSSWSPVSMRYFSMGREGYNRGRNQQIPPSRSLFVANVPWEATNEHLREVFSSHGTILRVSLFPDPQGGHKGCGRVDFSTLEDATAAYESAQDEPFLLMDRDLVVEYSKTPNVTPKTHTLFFRDFTGKEEDLQAILADYKDHIVRIAFSPPIREGQLWDRGHINFRNEDADIAEEVLSKFNGKMTSIGCRLHLEYSMNKRNPPLRREKRDNDNFDSY